MEDFFEKQSEFVKWLTWRKNLIGGWRQKDLADLIGVSQPTLSRILSGKKIPTAAEVIAFAYAFNDEEHIPDLIKMTGHGYILENVAERKKSIGIVDSHPGLFNNTPDTYDWWEYYYRRSEHM